MGQAKARKAEIAALKNGEVENGTDKVDTVYHYCKGVSLYSIFTDKFIATEQKRCINKAVKKNTNCTWFTSKETFPKTALPSIPGITSIGDIAKFTGGLFRFAVKLEEHNDVMRSKDSEERKVALRNFAWQAMETYANKVGDNVNCYFYSSNDVALENVTLQQYNQGNWVDVLPKLKISSVTAEQQTIIGDLMAKSAEVCKANGLRLHHV
jgi:hypothetical protein